MVGIEPVVELALTHSFTSANSAELVRTLRMKPVTDDGMQVVTIGRASARQERALPKLLKCFTPIAVKRAAKPGKRKAAIASVSALRHDTLKRLRRTVTTVHSADIERLLKSSS